MPRLWRYFIRSYFQVFFLCVSSFISILLVTRFQDIARFAATGAPKGYIGLFVLYQIPFILPLAIPISCLMGAMLLFQRMSRSHELTAMRSAGIGLFPITYPLILCGALLALLNFTIVSEMAPKCRSLSKGLAYQMTAINPLCLLQKETLIKLKNTYVDMDVLKSGKYAENATLIMRNYTNQRLGLMLAKELFIDGSELVGKDITFISTIPPKNAEGYDHLVIENQSEMHTRANELSQYLRGNDWNFNDDYLPLRALLAKHTENGKSFYEINGKTLQELGRRFSLGLAPLTFTLIGLAFGMEIGRERRKRGIMWATSLSATFLLFFIAAKSMKHSPLPALVCYLLPHPLIALSCLFGFRRIAKGVA
ncbi:MAG: hypothetical protein K940chlam2_00189 [Chlamydiae bacterium]|nr:hypothetical protein [Chlamydiota bacterium]